MTAVPLKRLFSQMALLTTARVAGAVCIFALTLLITRLFGAGMMAQYSVYLAIASLASVLLPCGFHAISSMIAAEYDARGQMPWVGVFARYGQKLIGAGGVVASALAVIAIALLPDDSSYDLPVILAGAVPSAVAMGLIYFNGSLLIGLQHQFAGQLPDTLVRPLLLVLTVSVMALALPVVSIGHLVSAASLVFVVTAVLQWQGLRRVLKGRVANPAPWGGERRKLWQLAPSWTVITLLWDYFIEIHILLASFLFAPVEVALLHICFRIRQLAGFGMQALYTLLMPKVFSANAREQDAETQSLIRLSCRITLGYAVAAWIGVALIGGFMLNVFGEEFRQGHGLLMIVMATLPVRAVFGPAPAVLGMKRNQRQVAQILIASLGLSLVLSLGGVKWGGLDAVAWGYLAATAFTAAAMWAAAKKKTGINCAVWA